MKSWKTTVFGALPQFFIILSELSKYFQGQEMNSELVMAAISSCVAFLFAKDYNVSGTQKEN